MGLVIEKTEVAYLKSFPCVVVKKTFQVTCGVASFQLFCRVPASSRRQKISMIFYNLPRSDEISVLGGVVIPMVEAECLKKSAAVIKVGLSRFRKPIGGLASVYHRWYSRCLKNSYNLAPVCRLYLPPCAKLRVPSDLCFDLELVNRLPNIQTEAEF